MRKGEELELSKWCAASFAQGERMARSLERIARSLEFLAIRAEVSDGTEVYSDRPPEALRRNALEIISAELEVDLDTRIPSTKRTLRVKPARCRAPRRA